jgi:hypothetical protein
LFSAANLELIRWTADRYPGLEPDGTAQTIGDNLPWKAPNGQLKAHAWLAAWEHRSTPDWNYCVLSHQQAPN